MTKMKTHSSEREEKITNKWVPSISIGFDRIESGNPIGSKNILKNPYIN